MAAALSAATGRAYDALDIPMTAFEPEGAVARLRLRDAGWLRCDLEDYRCAEIADPPAADSDEVASPDGRWAAFTRDYDSWVRDVASGAETRLTHGGTGNGGEPGDPYFEYLYRVGLDDGRVTLLTPDSANHDVSLSPEGRRGSWWSTTTGPAATTTRPTSYRRTTSRGSC